MRENDKADGPERMTLDMSNTDGGYSFKISNLNAGNVPVVKDSKVVNLGLWNEAKVSWGIKKQGSAEILWLEEDNGAELLAKQNKGKGEEKSAENSARAAGSSAGETPVVPEFRPNNLPKGLLKQEGGQLVSEVQIGELRFRQFILLPKDFQKTVNQAPSSVQIQSPVAGSVLTAGEVVSLEAVAVDANAEDQITYIWSIKAAIGDGPYVRLGGLEVRGVQGSVASAQYDFSSFSAGSYSLQVEASDASGLSVSSEVAVTIGSSQAPSARWSDDSPAEGEVLDFDGTSKSVDFRVAASEPNGGALDYQWFLDGNEILGVNADRTSMNFTAGGRHTVKVLISSQDSGESVISA